LVLEIRKNSQIISRLNITTTLLSILLICILVRPVSGGELQRLGLVGFRPLPRSYVKNSRWCLSLANSSDYALIIVFETPVKAF